MGITGSQHALMQCRSGVARSDATRSNYYSGGAVVIIVSQAVTRWVIER